MQNKLKQRQTGFDILRVFAIGCVVFSHALPQKINFQQLSPVDQWLNAAVIAIGHLGVPIFFMLSGYFLLKRDYSDATKIRQFYRTHFWPLLITLELWVLAYTLFLKLWLHRPTDLFQVFLDMTFISRTGRIGVGNYFFNYWFIPAILGLYLAVPFVARAVQHFPRRYLLAIYALVVSQTMLVPTITLFFNAQGLPGISVSQLDLSYFGGLSATYFFAGYLLRTQRHQPPLWLVGLGTLILTALIVTTQYYFQFTQYKQYTGGQLNMPYGYLLLLPCAWGLMNLAQHWQLHNSAGRFIFYRLAQLSFGVFLIHRGFSLVFIKLNWFTTLSVTRQTFVVWFVLFVLSYLVVGVLSLIPVLKRWLFLGR
ncbi:acyltransferase [Loigolactobacillus binensis]|uniref:Acyltransferase n=1 Tax=Loigolactobacillus binensis TaxID=2559922 RepID=A0ABW3EFH3_9LACO|nr:acyltransferase [Loigolactobacillus binensis]